MLPRRTLDKPWIVWCSPAVNSGGADQIGFCAHVEQLESPTKIFLNSETLPRS